ncbi:uncharacterized protein [Littorina saxatilis]|uniref:uncharacterized protein n=1 Tax=Littorina saxatilis TaxID=31220 RepID=UPI0038B5F988
MLIMHPHTFLLQAVCQSLVADTTAKAVQLCCCSDQLSQPASYWDVTDDVLSQLSTWWQHRMPCTPDTQLTDEQYLDIVARFVGPATTVSVPCYNGVRVEVRTAGQAVAELGRRLARLVLTLQQLDLMNRDPPRVCITGPPGTGKTVVLVQQALRWLLQGNDVQVISTRFSSRAVNAIITDHIQWSLRPSTGLHQTASQKPGTMTYHQFDFYKGEADTDTAIKKLEACEKDGKLFVLIDEAHFIARDDAGKRHTKLISELTQSVPELHLWAACVQHIDIPKELQHEEFTVPLRCAPVIQRVITPVVKMVSKQVREYTDCGVPAPGDGLRVVELSHHGNDHTGQWPAECNKCGKEVAAELRRLDVGRAGGTLTNSPAALSYRDVFILTRSSELHDDAKDDAGNVTSPASGVVRGLRDAGVPVCVLAQQDAQQNKAQRKKDVESVALAKEDEVTVTHYGDVQGLERRVVVVLQGKTNVADKHRRKNDIEVVDILDAVSRCTTQLIVVKKEEKMCVVL